MLIGMTVGIVFIVAGAVALVRPALVENRVQRTR
jgi:hypothetical protein